MFQLVYLPTRFYSEGFSRDFEFELYFKKRDIKFCWTKYLNCTLLFYSSELSLT